MKFEHALLCMHGMGNLPKNEFVADIERLKQKLARRMPVDKFSKIYIPASGIFYSDLTQTQEDKVWEKMIDSGKLSNGFIRSKTINPIRRFMISGFSDATAFIGTDGLSSTNQQYTAVQKLIYDALVDVHKNCGNVPVTIISLSLGCQILSNYLWDAQLYWRNTNNGDHFPIDSRSIWNNHQRTDNDNFLCLQLLKTWFTTGCNIPIFVSGFKNVLAVHNRDYGYNFDWINYYDYDDMLGYPLTPLEVLFDPNSNNTHGQSYAQAATDIQVNANDGAWGAITSSWNPLSHLQYWGDDTVLDALADAINRPA